MIVCHCNVLTSQAILAAIDTLLEEDPYRLITPGLVYRHLGKRGKCGGCLPQTIGLILRRLEEFQTRNPDMRVENSLAGLMSMAPQGNGLHAVASQPMLQRDD